MKKDPIKSILAVALCTALLCIAPALSAQDFLYGLTESGGLYDQGVPYRISTTGIGFNSYGNLDGVVAGKPGIAAGFMQIGTMMVAMTELGNANFSSPGAFIRIYFNAAILESSPNFGFTAFTNGGSPSGKFLLAHDGKLYGYSPAGGPSDAGVLFRSTFWGDQLSGFANFDVTTGRMPKGAPVEGLHSKLYGVTEFGGENDLGVIFSVAIYGQPGINPLFHFDGVTSGANPSGSLVLATDGKLYGMTKAGGANDHGVIFRIAQDGTGFTKLHDFDGAVSGQEPLGALVEFTDGKLYGMTSSGGADNFGTVFSISTAGTFQKIVDFDGDNGRSPVGELVVSPSGTTMYGTAFAGGVNDLGTLFKLENGTTLVKLYDYTIAGSHPVGALAMERLPQTITFAPIPLKNTLSEPFSLDVSSTSGLPVYVQNITQSVALVDNTTNNLVTITGPGSAGLMSYQLGNFKYLPVTFPLHGNFDPPPAQLLTVEKVQQTITFAPLPEKTYGNPAFTLEATSSSGLPVLFASADGNIASVSSNQATLKDGGAVYIIARQAGNDIYEAAPNVTQKLVINKAEQSITLTVPTTVACCNNFSISATCSAGAEIFFRTSTPDIVTAGSSVSIQRAGMAEVTAYHIGNTRYLPVETKKSVEITKGFQEILANNLPDAIELGSAPLVFYGAATDPGLPVEASSQPAGVAVAEGGKLYALGVGDATITLSQSGNEKYLPAGTVTRVVKVVAPAIPLLGNAITWPDFQGNKFITSPAFDLTAWAASGLPVAYTSSNPAVATISGNRVTIVGEGTTTIVASQAGTGNIPAAASVQKNLIVEKAQQFIHLPFSDNSPRPLVLMGAIPLPTLSSANLPITYTVPDPAALKIENFAMIVTGNGNPVLIATQPGNATYAAVTVQQQFSLQKVTHFITFGPIAAKTLGDAPFTLEATTSSGLPVVYSVDKPDVVSVAFDSGTVTILKPGTVRITAQSNGSTGFFAAPSVSQDLVISKKAQSISFESISSKTLGDPAFGVQVSSNSILPVTLTTTTPGVVRVTGNAITITGSGTAKVVASQQGNDYYLPAESVIQSFDVDSEITTYSMVVSAYSGGPSDNGFVFGLNSNGGDKTPLKVFSPRSNPQFMNGFIMGPDGNFYANTRAGGVNHNGSVVRMNADGTGYTEIASYDAATTGGTPSGNLLSASDGQLYGTTNIGGENDQGTIIKVNADGTGMTVLHHFVDSYDGSRPASDLFEGSDGRLYGATQYGGFTGHGTIFSLNMDGTDFTVLFNMRYTGEGITGYDFRGRLTEDTYGFLYGAFREAGSGFNGTIFRLRKDGTEFSNLYEFEQSAENGKSPFSPILCSDGKLYGVAQAGGIDGSGLVYSINTDGSGFTKVFEFGGGNGWSPIGTLTEGSDGSLYGTTDSGGLDGKGTVYRIARDGSGFTVLHNFDVATGWLPSHGQLAESTAGDFFGTTQVGGASDAGVVYRITSTGTRTLLKEFPQQDGNPTQLVSDPAGENYYGLAVWPVVGSSGSIFRMNADGSVYERIYDIPINVIINNIFFTSSGHIWGFALDANGEHIFRIKTDGTGYEKILEFNNEALMGASSRWLVESNGFIYVVTGAGGAHSGGTFIRFDLEGTGFTKLTDLPKPSGWYGASHFIMASDGKFYGVPYEQGDVFSISTTGVYTKIYDQRSDVAGYAARRIVELNSGHLAICTVGNGPMGSGTIYSIAKDGSQFNYIYHFNPDEGTRPWEMRVSTDGWLYVSTDISGPNGDGALFKIRGDGSSYTLLNAGSRANGILIFSFFFKKTTPSFTFSPIPGKKVSDLPFQPETLSPPGTPVIFTSSDPTVAIVENGLIKPVSSGTVTITATFAESANYFAGGSLQQQLVITKGIQSISFDAIPDVRMGTDAFLLPAIASSGLELIFSSSNPNVAAVSGNMVVMIGIGTTTITASQPGNDDYFPAENVERALKVLTDGIQIITLPAPPRVVIGGPDFQLTATATSGLPVTLVKKSQNISISGSTVTMLATGVAEVEATQAGGGDWFPAPPLTLTFCVNPPKVTITVTSTTPQYNVEASGTGDFQWFKNGEPLSGTASFRTLLDEGSYSVQNVVEGECYGDMSDPHVVVATGLDDEPVESAINIYPNPTSDVLNVELRGNVLPVAIHLIDGTGRTILTRESQGNTTEVIDIRDTGPGLFIIRIAEGNNILLRRVVKF